jgi:flavin reductase (DIM6/NTAB) family NADH-FMN oxidoreductase RutF
MAASAVSIRPEPETHLDDLRACLSRFATGVTVVTMVDGERPHGITVSAFTSVSLDPPLVLVSINKAAHAHELLAKQPFAVNVLRAEQEGVARHFAGKTRPNLAVQWEHGELVPCLRSALATVECEPWAAYDGGDHTLYLGRVAAFRHAEGSALGWFESRFMPIEPPGGARAFPREDWDGPR